MIDIRSRSSIAIFFVLVTVTIVFVLALVVLNTMTSQTRLTHHQVSRVQAYYAAQAGIAYTLDMLRIGSPNGYTLASCPSPGDCNLSDASFPSSVVGKQVAIQIIALGQPGCTSAPAGSAACIKTTATYTYTP